MQITKTQKIILSIVIILILVGVYVFFDRKSVNQGENIIATTTDQTTPVTTNSTGKTTSNISNVEATGGYTIEQVSGNEGLGVPQPVPDLNRKVTVYQGVKVTPEAKTVATEKILSLQKALKNNTADLKSWINLGIYQKMAGDYNGAVLSWKYAGRLSPTDYVSVGNLANLYAYFLNDTVKAEMYYKEAILKVPNVSNLYIHLAEFYRDIFKDKNKALDIVNQGLSKIPNDANLLQLKAQLGTP